jgi:ATP-dependent RNA helicase DHX57
MLEIKQSMREFMTDLVDIGLLSSVHNGLDVNDTVANVNAMRANLMAATYCAGLYPQVAKIIRPPKRFMEVMGGAMEREADAKEIKIYVPKLTTTTDDDKMLDNPLKRLCGRGTNADFDIDTENLQRVFIHPSSINFQNNAFKSSNYVLFGEKQVVQTPGQDNGHGTKIYLRDTSEVTAYSLLFFGGEMNYDFDAGVLVIDNWIRLVLFELKCC